MLDISNPRQSARDAIRNSVPVATWQENARYCESLRAAIEEHRIMRHPLIEKFEHGEYDLRAQQFVHLEFRTAFAQIFTDALIQAMVTTAQVEPFAGALGKVASRFLLQLNVLDELGFVASPTAVQAHAGHPALSHYVQFDETLRQLELSVEDVAQFQPSAQARACRASFEDQYHDHVALAAVMALSETVFGRFSGPWSKSVGARTPIDVGDGYHSIHVEHDGEFIDDGHSEDAWLVFQQAITPARYAEISARVLGWLDTWAGFVDHLAGLPAHASAPALAPA